MAATTPRTTIAARVAANGGWREALDSSRRHVRQNRVNVAAGAFAFRWFLSIFPLIIALLGVASLVSLPRHTVVALIHGVSRALPSGAARVFTTAITHADARTAGDWTATVLASLVALWSALSGMVIVEEGLDMAFGLATDRSFLAKRIVAVPLLAGSVVLGSVASALVVFGGPLGDAVANHAPFGRAAFAVVWTVARWLVALAVVNVLFSLLYHLAPNRPRPRWRWTSHGAVVATIVWALVSLGFSLYTTDFSSYARTYGAFAGVAILILWLYLTGLAILVGGEVDAALERLVDGGDVPPTVPPGHTGA